jgi:hypothetical protein
VGRMRAVRLLGGCGWVRYLGCGTVGWVGKGGFWVKGGGVFVYLPDRGLGLEEHGLQLGVLQCGQPLGVPVPDDDDGLPLGAAPLRLHVGDLDGACKKPRALEQGVLLGATCLRRRQAAVWAALLEDRGLAGAGLARPGTDCIGDGHFSSRQAGPRSCAIHPAGVAQLTLRRSAFQLGSRCSASPCSAVDRHPRGMEGGTSSPVTVVTRLSLMALHLDGWLGVGG